MYGDALTGAPADHGVRPSLQVWAVARCNCWVARSMAHIL
jgi:hypothetical protein